MDIYILELEGKKYYVGRSDNVQNRLKDHFAGRGSVWTKEHKPIRVMRTFKSTSLFDEDKCVKEMMAKHGIDDVRGGSYSMIKMSKTDRAHLEKEVCGALDLCFYCQGNDHFSSGCRNKRKRAEPIDGGYEKYAKKGPGLINPAPDATKGWCHIM